MPTPPYTAQDIKEAKTLLGSQKVGFISFSEGTYQVEVKEKGGPFWPLLQIDDKGNVQGGLCNCPALEKKKSCPHLAAAYLKIFSGHETPLHVRFRTSFWNQLGYIAYRRHGAKALKKTAHGYEALSVTGRRLFVIKPLNPKCQKFLEEILFSREQETEETSLKFSNLPPEEIALWRLGRPSHQLLYELSFFSDLAKWWMQLQDAQKEYHISFEGEDLPKEVHVHFGELDFRCYLAEVNWPDLIPTLTTVSSPLIAYELQEQKIEKIRYDPAHQKFDLDVTPLPPLQEGKRSGGITLGAWIFVPHEGFFPAEIDPILKQKEVPREKIAYLLQHHAQLIQKYLVGTSLHPQGISPQYHLFFDAEDCLHISCYLFEKGDLKKPTSAYFGPWVYVEDKGFYVLENLLFDGVEKMVLREQISEFINRHRLWLNQFEGFQTHISSIESQITFFLDEKDSLRFESGLEASVEGGMVDFGEWIHLKGKGFFAKKMGRGGSIHPHIAIPTEQITPFIRAHLDELESIRGFFASSCPLEKSGLEVFLNEKEKIVVRPKFQFASPYSSSTVKIVGDYTYVAHEGFCEIPFEKRLPEGFFSEKIISTADEPFFIAYELDALAPYILSIQQELQRPQELSIRVQRMRRYVRTKTPEWLIELCYESERGSVSAYTIWKALVENKRYIFTPAGLIVLKNSRFNWLKNIPKKRWLKKGASLRLKTLDWLRLSVFDDVQAPPSSTPHAAQTRELLQELHTFHTDHPINLSGFTSDLRAYQETGVKWLWFLYCNGLSGLLCDEMGLGKTHQAMGLMAAAKNQALARISPTLSGNLHTPSTNLDSSVAEAVLHKHCPRPSENQSQPTERQFSARLCGKCGLGKYLVVCPTSVIYHWEELLKRFLPNMKVHIFYGASRKLEAFQEDLLLTSYGTLRSEKKDLSKIPFDIAIFDEIQIAKNSHSQTHKALRKINASMRIGLTGTPIENRLLELKALFDLIVPGYMPQEAHFKELFVNPIEKNQDPERKALFKRFVHHFILRRKKSEVLLELPSKTEEIAYCDLSEEQHALYHNTFLKHKESLVHDLQDKHKPVPYMHVFALLSSLKQICDHPCLITKKFDEFHKHRSGKWDLFVELLQEARESGQKLVVFSQYLEMLSMIEAHLTENRIQFAAIRGSTRNRSVQLELFRDNPQCEVFVASLQAVGVGVDLTSASVVIHYDRWWNPARENQATDRVHRIGQNRGVQVFKMVTKHTIEEHIHHLIEKKLALIEGVIDFDDQDQIKGLNRQDLLELLRLIEGDVSGGG